VATGVCTYISELAESLHLRSEAHSLQCYCLHDSDLKF
jgi:hypothetical protein